MKANATGLVLIDKPSGITSFKALEDIKRSVGHRKVGHAGTLDKFARGLLVAGVGKCTRLISIFESLRKEYEGTICFGKTTSTLDPEGDFTETADPPLIEEIKSVIPGFIGRIMQVPPVYSALHVDGRRAYQRIRAGEEVRLEPRPVEIYSIDVLSWKSPDLTVRVQCSKGTYIRALARDIAAAAGSVGYLSSLTRTRIGSFSLKEAVKPSNFSPEQHLLHPADFLGSIPMISRAYVEDEKVAGILNGSPFSPQWIHEKIDGEMIALFDSHNSFLALVEKTDVKWKYRMVADGGSR